MYNILFVHNAIPEYRYAFFKHLSDLVNLQLYITESEVASKIYNFKSNIPSELDIIYAKNYQDIIDEIYKSNYDCVVLPPLDNLRQLTFAFMAFHACRKRKVHIAYWTEKWEANSDLQPFAKRIKNFLQAKAITFFAKKSDVCIAAGIKQKQYLLNNGIEESKIKIAIDSSTSPKNMDFVNIRNEYKIQDNSRIILFLGRLIKRKGCQLLVDAVSKLNSDNWNLHLLVCGVGDEEAFLKNEIMTKNLQNITFCGKIQPNQRAAYFAQSDVFVLPSYTCEGVIEAWGLTCNEALEQGTPVIATTAVGAAHDLADGKCCLMVEENNVEALAEALRQILSDESLEKCCKERYALFSVRQMAESFYKAFNSIM